MTKQQEILIKLVRLGIITDLSGRYIFYNHPLTIDWDDLWDMAGRQGVSAIVLDGIEKMPQTIRPPQETLLQWIGEVLQNYEARYEDYRHKIGKLAEFYNKHGYRMMVLKGYGLSLNYPKPSHRPCGDIDIWLFGKQKEADSVISNECGITVDKGHHHHTVFEWEDYTVENHYDFVNVHYGHKNAELEISFKELAQDDTNVVVVDGQAVYLPSVNLHALFLLRHCMQDFAAAEMNLRQLLDWGFFVKKHTSEIDWKWLYQMLEQFKMKDFFNCINAICVEELGFETSIFKTVQFCPEMKGKVLKDILAPQFSREEPMWLIPRLIYKYRRWKGNAWKQELCYSDSRVSSFFSGLWNHILKPS